MNAFIEEIEKYQKNSSRFKLVFVSKGHSLLHVRNTLEKWPMESFVCGENYFQELEKKVSGHKKILQPHIDWHFLGTIQSRKFPKLTQLTTTFHAVSRLKELELIQAHPSLKFFLQVNISSEPTKQGCQKKDLEALLSFILRNNMEHSFLGFMGIASSLDQGERIVATQFRSLRKIRDEYASTKLLNMGMSADYKIALEEGADWIRLGSSVFGARI